MNLRHISTLPLSIVVVLLPLVAQAQTLTEQLRGANNVLNALMGVFIALAIVVFFWGLIRYLWSANAENASAGLKLMFWGVIALFVMVSVWGIIALLQRSFGVGGGGAIIPDAIDLRGFGGGAADPGQLPDDCIYRGDC